jgi:hypothetical protein
LLQVVRPYQLLEAKANASANNATLIHSTAEGNTADCDLVFCGKRSGCGDGEGHMIDCYCCELDPDRNHSCYTRGLQFRRNIAEISEISSFSLRSEKKFISVKFFRLNSSSSPKLHQTTLK